MNDELITRLRAAHDDCPVPAEPSLYSAAADALEAAQAELTQARGIIEHWQRRFDVPIHEEGVAQAIAAALAAHRERRTKEND